MKRHFSYAELVSIESVSARFTTARKQETKPVFKTKSQKRPRLKKIEAVTSSSRKNAFWMNEFNTVNKVDTRSMPKKAYYKFFEQYILIKDDEIQEFMQRNIKIYYR